MEKTQTIRTIKAVTFSGTDCPKLPKTLPAGVARKQHDPASSERVEKYPIPSFLEYRSVGADRCRVIG